MSINNQFLQHCNYKEISMQQNSLQGSNIANSSDYDVQAFQSKAQKKTAQNIDRKKLEGTRQKLKSFVKMIGGKKVSKIRADILKHCNKLRMNIKQNLSFEQVQKMINSRIQKMIKNKRYKQNWSQQDLNILVWVVSKYADWYNIEDIERDLTNDAWEFIANLIPGIQNKDACRFKWLSLQKNNLSDNNWSEAESNELYKIVMENQRQDWAKISQLLYDNSNLENKIYRCPKQCRQHWNCFLNPKLKKGPWQKQEDLRLLAYVNKNNGLKKWSQIVVHFNGRTQNSLKNRYNLIIEKQIKTESKKANLSEVQIIKSILQREYLQQFVDQNGQKLNKAAGDLKQDAQQINNQVQNFKQIYKRKNILIQKKSNLQKLKQSCTSESKFRTEMAKIRKANKKKDDDSQNSSDQYSPPKKSKNVSKGFERCYHQRQRRTKNEKSKEGSKKSLIYPQQFGDQFQKLNHYSSINNQKSMVFKQSNLFDINAGFVSNILQNSKIFMNSPLQIDYQIQKSSLQQASVHNIFEENNPLYQLNVMEKLKNCGQNSAMGLQNSKSQNLERADLKGIQIIEMSSQLFAKIKDQYHDKDKKINLFVPCILEKESNKLKYFNFQQ